MKAPLPKFCESFNNIRVKFSRERWGAKKTPRPRHWQARFTTDFATSDKARIYAESRRKT
jgi:hypothetical protein